MKAIDLFAGAGGFTAGAHRAGLEVVWAANHSPIAVETHAANHPETEHSCQDLRQADFSLVPSYDLLLASPACQGHSTASQPRRRPKHDADRSTAFAVVDCVDVTEPAAFIVENVPSFRRWRLYSGWKAMLASCGYAIEEYELDAADHGTPQNRKRLFVVGFRSKTAPKLRFEKQAPISIRTVLDSKSGGWASVDSKTDGVKARIAKARARKLGRRFLTQHVTGHPGRSLDRPIGTITCVSGHWHLVEGDRIRALSIRELARAQGFRDSFELPPGVKVGTRLVGNAVPPPLAETVIRAVAAV